MECKAYLANHRDGVTWSVEYGTHCAVVRQVRGKTVGVAYRMSDGKWTWRQEGTVPDHIRASVIDLCNFQMRHEQEIGA